MPVEYVRVRDTSGHEITVRADRVAEGVQVIDKPALDRSGDPLPPKYRMKLGTPLPGSKQARKKSARKAAKKAPAAKKAATTQTPPAAPETSTGQSADHQEEN